MFVNVQPNNGQGHRKMGGAAASREESQGLGSEGIVAYSKNKDLMFSNILR